MPPPSSRPEGPEPQRPGPRRRPPGRESTTGGRTGPSRAGRDLRLAIASGVLLAVGFVGTLALDPYAFLAFVALIVVVGLLEVDHAVRKQDLRPATPVAVVAGLLMLFGTYVAGNVALAVGCGVLTLGTLLWPLLDSRRRHVTHSIAATLFMTLWVPFLASFLGLLLARADGAWLVMTTVAYSVSNDIGAYGFGSVLGRHRMAPAISPAKTWEGVAGGLVTVMVVAAFVTPAVTQTLAVWQALVLGAVIATASTVGDLVESMVKRDLGVKDFGRVVPGHGGIMDRVDALLLAVPAAHLVLLAFGL